jgi:hypothetical protein
VYSKLVLGVARVGLSDTPMPVFEMNPAEADHQLFAPQAEISGESPAHASRSVCRRHLWTPGPWRLRSERSDSVVGYLAAEC